LNTYLINGETWLICGGRDFSQESTFRSAMIQIMELRGCPAKVVQGGARGADRMAAEWARLMAIEVIEVRADWQKYGKAAGSIRNTLMLKAHRPHVVIAFPGGPGTRDMVKKANAACGIDVIEIKLNCRGGTAHAPGAAQSTKENL